MRIKELILLANDIEAQKRFYKQLFPVSFLKEESHQFSIQIGWTKLTFKHTIKSQNSYHYCFLIPSNQLENAIDWMKGKVELIRSNGSVIHHHVNWNAKAIYFFDGDGNIAEFIARYDLKNDSNSEFTHYDIICVNEIGVPSNDPTHLNMILEKKLNTSIWKGDLKRFAVNGDLEGMFLLVNNTVKDKWYPTNIYPASLPFESIIYNNGEIIDISFDGQQIT